MSISPPPVSARAASPAHGWRHRLPRLSVLAALLLSGTHPGGEAAAALMQSSPLDTPRSPGTLHEEILRLLDRSEAFPREADWAPLGPDALTELSGLANDPKASETQRARAVTAMAVVAHPEASVRLQALLRPSATPPSVRSAAALALARRTGLESVPSLAPLLEDRSEAVRAAAAQMLGRVGGAEARKVLEERLALEEKLEVREAIQRGLSYIEP
ncbi:MAG TPA: HEAT repeat domain-containing protein [Archangium sp.]|jgi:HEAT repeat protein|uniref:HEAT repeat domain-containing protein n=1 Tax=Archangium sp. TaxID=1872627 RepID=UPI002ED891E0